VRDGAPFTRGELVAWLESRKIATRMLFAGDMTRQPAFKDAPHRVVGELRNTERVMRDTFWIGVWPGCHRRDARVGGDELRGVLREARAQDR
jgi:CDP-6-deoxy-D-xylo-4-hexulose-3-dehydrase